MYRTTVYVSIILFLGAALCAAQEELTITTYYPSPYGVYRELRSQRMAIGDNYYETADYCWPPDACANTIDNDADLIVEGSVGIGKFNTHDMDCTKVDVMRNSRGSSIAARNQRGGDARQL